jgi:hypothetical protein
MSWHSSLPSLGGVFEFYIYAVGVRIVHFIKETVGRLIKLYQAPNRWRIQTSSSYLIFPLAFVAEPLEHKVFDCLLPEF